MNFLFGDGIKVSTTTSFQLNPKVYNGAKNSTSCWYLPTDDAFKIGPWIGPRPMIQGRANQKASDEKKNFFLSS